MDAPDQWTSPVSSSPSLRRYPVQSEAFFEGDDLEDDEVSILEFSCPFCAEEYDVLGLVYHLDHGHPVEMKNGVCPVCAKRVGTDLGNHITMQHGSLLQIPSMKLRRGSPNAILNILRKEMREGRGSSLAVPSNPEPDPLLSSFIYSSACAEKLGKRDSQSSLDLASLPESDENANGSSQQQPVLTKQEHEEKTQECEFVRGILLSTMLDEIL